MLQLTGIRKRFGATVALDGVDLTVGPGEVLAIIGENGAGKSTLMNIIAGVYPADAGRVEVDETRMSYIRQELSLFPHLTVAENIMMGREPSRFGFVASERMIRSTRDLLAEFGRPEIQTDARAGDLSPAARQVVEICRALAKNATLILMDEPTSSLQRADVDRLFAAIRELCAQGISIVYVSHFLEEIREIATRAVVLRDGKSVWSGEVNGITDDELIAQMVGRVVDVAVRTSRPHAFGAVVLEVDSAPAGGFKLHRGEILGIAGLVGSGRTELVRAIFGLDPATNVEITLRGKPVSVGRHDPASSIRNGVGYLSEDRNAEGLLPHLSVRDNITMTRPEDRETSEWIQRLKIRTPNPLSSVRYLSGGNQQKVLFARLLHQRADILLLDEPTRGIDVGTKAEIYDHIRRMASEGKAILLVSSYLPELFGICDTLAVMSRGRISVVRPVGEWTPDSVLQFATAVGP